MAYEVQNELPTVERLKVENDDADDSRKVNSRFRIRRGKTFCYVNVEAEGKKIMCGIREVNQLWYIPPQLVKCDAIFTWDRSGKFVIDKDGNQIKKEQRSTHKVPEKWLGYNNKTKTKFVLPERFI